MIIGNAIVAVEINTIFVENRESKMRNKPNKDKKTSHFQKKLSRNTLIHRERVLELKTIRLRKKYSEMLWFCWPLTVAELPTAEWEW